jgi:hypothetical protein
MSKRMDEEFEAGRQSVSRNLQDWFDHDFGLPANNRQEDRRLEVAKDVAAEMHGGLQELPSTSTANEAAFRRGQWHALGEFEHAHGISVPLAQEKQKESPEIEQDFGMSL